MQQGAYFHQQADSQRGASAGTGAEKGAREGAGESAVEVVGAGAAAGVANWTPEHTHGSVCLPHPACILSSSCPHPGLASAFVLCLYLITHFSMHVIYGAGVRCSHFAHRF